MSTVRVVAVAALFAAAASLAAWGGASPGAPSEGVSPTASASSSASIVTVRQERTFYTSAEYGFTLSWLDMTLVSDGPRPTERPTGGFAVLHEIRLASNQPEEGLPELECLVWVCERPAWLRGSRATVRRALGRERRKILQLLRQWDGERLADGVTASQLQVAPAVDYLDPNVTVVFSDLESSGDLLQWSVDLTVGERHVFCRQMLMRGQSQLVVQQVQELMNSLDLVG